MLNLLEVLFLLFFNKLKWFERWMKPVKLNLRLYPVMRQFHFRSASSLGLSISQLASFDWKNLSKRYVRCDTTSYSKKTYEKQTFLSSLWCIFAIRVSKSSKAHTRKRVKDLKLRISIMLKGQPFGLGLTSFTRDLIIICINFLFTWIVKIYFLSILNCID